MRPTWLSGTVIVTGTGTDVGKTVVTAMLAAVAQADGMSVMVVKPAQTGVGEGEPGDVAEVRRLAGLATDGSQTREFVRLLEPLAPNIAARRAGVTLDSVRVHAARIRDLSDTCDLVLVEGSGGALVRLDREGGTIADLARHLTGAATVVVVEAELGTLNHSELTAEALRHRGVNIAGLIVGSWPEHPGAAEWENLVALPQVTGVPLFGMIPEGAGALDPETFQRTAGTWLEPMYALAGAAC